MVIKSLEVTVMSAKDLPNVNVIHTMDPYVIVSLSGNHKQRTHVHKNGGTSPRWVKLLTFPVDEARADLLILMFEIMTEKTYGGDKEVGKIEVPIAELLEKQGDGKPKEISYSVSLPSGKTQGVLEFNYKFGEELPGGCGNTPAPEQGPTKKSGGQGWINGLAGGLAVGLASGLVDGSASVLAGELIDGLFGTAQPEAAVDGPEAAVDGPEAAVDEPDEPEAAVDGPEAAVDGPEAAVDEPNEPEAAVDEPEAAVDGPEAATNGSEVAVDGPEAAVDEPEAAVDGPEAAVDEPDEPEAAVDEPEAAVDGPEAAVDEPDEPKAAMDEPEAAVDGPEAATNGSEVAEDK